MEKTLLWLQRSVFQVMNCNLIFFITWNWKSLKPNHNYFEENILLFSVMLLFSVGCISIITIMVYYCHWGIFPCSKFTSKVQNFGRSPSGADRYVHLYRIYDNSRHFTPRKATFRQVSITTTTSTKLKKRFPSHLNSKLKGK